MNTGKLDDYNPQILLDLIKKGHPSQADWKQIATELAEALECMIKAATENNCGLKIADEALQKYKQTIGE